MKQESTEKHFFILNNNVATGNWCVRRTHFSKRELQHTVSDFWCFYTSLVISEGDGRITD